MALVEIAVIALALAVDAFTVGLAVGLTHRSPREIFRMSFHFGLFQALLPLLGAYGGRFVGGWLEDWKHWIAFALLFLVGAKMIYEAISTKAEQSRRNPTKGFALVALSIAVSIDALAVGFTLGLQEISIPLAVLVIGLTAALLTWFGMRLAGVFASKLGKRAGLVAGLVLIGLGIKILLENGL